MDNRRPHSRSHYNHNRRRHPNSNLNPSANDFIPGQNLGPGPSHSRDNAPSEDRSRNQEYADYRGYNPRNNERPAFNNRSHNSNNHVNQTSDSPRGNNSNRSNHGQRSPQMFERGIYHYAINPDDFQRDPPPRSSHNQSNVRNNSAHRGNGKHFDSGRPNQRTSNERSNSNHDQNSNWRLNDVRGNPSPQFNNSRSNSNNGPNQNRGSNDVRFDDTYEGQANNQRSGDVRFVNNYNYHNNNPNSERQERSLRGGQGNDNVSRRNQFGKPNRDRRQNNRYSNNDRDSPYPNSNIDTQDSSSKIVGTIGYMKVVQLEDSLSNFKFNLDEEVTSQRDKLIQILFKGTQECLVCCERIKQVQSIWSCGKCFNIFHLLCTIQWADSSQTEQGWRCPACQNISSEVPREYQCFCKKQVLDIGWNHLDTPHSCGEVCGRDLSRGTTPCGHRCMLLCHPGPCPVCEIVITRYCGCERTNCQLQCGSTKELTCPSVCNKPLNCQQHRCEAICHEGSCQPCTQLLEQKCFCGTNTKSIVCSDNVELNYSCESTCGKQLECGNHTCSNTCHPGPCDLCYLIPQFITTCCCGKTLLNANQKRKSCNDPIPTCTQVCSKTLHCGDMEENHKCKAQCHRGDCPTCKLNSVVLCNCKQRKRQIQCSELKPGAVVKCNIKCSVMRSCGKHKCNQACCTTQDHICPLTCNKKLRCGTHKCELLCHNGTCPSCMNVSFEELTCRCGVEVIYPPVPCGTKRPVCAQVCTRSHPCPHPPAHSCHDEPECPPCVVFTEKWCFGLHQVRKNVFCYVNSFSCGQACGKVLKCQRHFCNLPCHEGDCLKPNEKCKQLCTKPRPACGHPCNDKCHPGVCPGSTCTMKISVTCSCGERSETQACIEDSSLLEQFNKTSKGEYKILECNETCVQIERNRRLALGLQIRNPDLNLKLKPLYPDILKQWAKKDPDFCNYVHSKLADLVKLSKESKQKSRSFSFEVMNRDKRQFVHGYCEFFGINAVDCDPEPKRNVLVTAFKDKAWLPGYSLMETIQREKGQPKVPMLPSRDNMAMTSRSEMVQLGGKKS
uniref:Protein shuttle craft n=1 Tax=Cacopsylla melanoneura TaxID=428564 RepID=A0A8D8Y9T2_9HEMI